MNPTPKTTNLTQIPGSAGPSPLVARYTDGCTPFGAPSTVRHEIAALERHRERIGRDPGEILKTAA